MVYGWIDRYDDLVNQCRGSPFFCHPDIPLLLLVQTKSGITKKEAAPPQSILGRNRYQELEVIEQWLIRHLEGISISLRTSLVGMIFCIIRRGIIVTSQKKVNI